jgi:hypothetical protein
LCPNKDIAKKKTTKGHNMTHEDFNENVVYLYDHLKKIKELNIRNFDFGTFKDEVLEIQESKEYIKESFNDAFLYCTKYIEDRYLYSGFVIECIDDLLDYVYFLMIFLPYNVLKEVIKRSSESFQDFVSTINVDNGEVIKLRCLIQMDDSIQKLKELSTSDEIPENLKDSLAKKILKLSIISEFGSALIKETDSGDFLKLINKYLENDAKNIKP